MNKIEETLKLLELENIIPSTGLFEITESILNHYIDAYGSLQVSSNLNKIHEIEFARKLAGINLLKLKFSRGGSAKDCKEGLFYIIANPAWLEHLKIGMTTDLNKRLASYQTYDPFKKFYVKHYEFSLNRRFTEETVLKTFNIHLESGEWIKFDMSEKIIRCVRNNYYLDV